jgi:hypothetical protein
MWIRKSALEIETLLNQKETQKKSLKRPFIFGAFFGLAFILLDYFGFRGGTRGFYVFAQQNGFGLRTLFVGTFGFMLFFGLAYYHQRKGSPFLSDDKCFRCDSCRELSPTNAENLCPCGGSLESPEYYTWEEDPEPEKAPAG